MSPVGAGKAVAGQRGRGRKAPRADQISGGSDSAGTRSDPEGQSGKPVFEHFCAVSGAGRFLRGIGVGGGWASGAAAPRGGLGGWR